MICKYFLSFGMVLFYFVDGFICLQKLLASFSPFCLFLLLWLLLLVSDSNNHHQDICQGVYLPTFSSGSFIASRFYVQCLMYFELISCMLLDSSLVHLFCCSCPLFLTLFIEGNVLSQLYLLGLFVIN